MFFFDLLKRNQFTNSMLFTKNNLSAISKEIEKKYNVTIINPTFNNSERIEFFFKQFNIIKVSWKKLVGGYKKQELVSKLQNSFVNFSLNDNEFERKEGKYKND